MHKRHGTPISRPQPELSGSIRSNVPTKVGPREASPCTSDRFDVRLTSVQRSVQKLSAFRIENVFIRAYSMNLLDFQPKSYELSRPFGAAFLGRNCLILECKSYLGNGQINRVTI